MKRSLALFLLLAMTSKSHAFDLVRHGEPAATIIVADKASDFDRYAAKLLATRLEQGCGKPFQIVNESQRTAGSAAIAVGRTSFATDLLTDLMPRKSDPYRLRVRDNVLVVVGRDSEVFINNGDKPVPFIDPQGNPRYFLQGATGTIRGVIGLLEKLGYRWLQPSAEGLYVPKLVDASVPDDLNHLWEPWVSYSVGFRVAGAANQPEFMLANNHRFTVKFLTRGGHTWADFVPTKLYDAHPEYFRMKNGVREKPDKNNPMLCPSNPVVQKLMADGLRRFFDMGYEMVELGQSDGYMACECDQCRALDKPGEIQEQLHIAHRNVIEMVRQTHPDKLVNMIIYGPTSKPSARFDKYPPNTVLQLCAYDREALELWSPKAPAGLTTYVYYMGTWQDQGLAPKFTPRQAQEELRRFHEFHIAGIYWCNGGENWGAEGPTYYAIGRLMSDPTLDWRQLLGEYCRLTFGNAAGAMENYYRLLYTRIGATPHSSDGRSSFVSRYSPSVLDQLEQYLEAAKTQAKGDSRVLGWIRTAELSYKHIALIARVYHVYGAYEINRNAENLSQVSRAVAQFKAFAAKLKRILTEEREFVNAFFPGSHWWANASSNEHRLGSPFPWGFDELAKTGDLPGATKKKDVAKRAAKPPTIDGGVSEAVWNDLGWRDIGGIFMAKSDAQTQVSCGYDDQNLYVAFRCTEPRWDGFHMRPTGRDSKAIYEQECIEVFLSPEGGDKYMHFIVAPADGAVYDGRKGYITDPLHPLVLSGGEDIEWNPDFQRAWRVNDKEKQWSVELAIPFQALGVSAPRDADRWFVNFGRERFAPSRAANGSTEKVELFLWSPNLERGSFLETHVFGELFFNRMP